MATKKKKVESTTTVNCRLTETRIKYIDLCYTRLGGVKQKPGWKPNTMRAVTRTEKIEFLLDRLFAMTENGIPLFETVK